MEIENDLTEAGLSSRDTYVRAKIDLYLERAAEYFLCGRYRATLTVLDNVWRLDPANKEANQLRDHVNEMLSSLSLNPPSPGPDGHLSPVMRHHEIVLVVDQDPRVLSGLVDTLHNYGFPCVGADCYDEALEALTLCTPSVVLSEMNFAEGPRGFDLFRHMKSGHAPMDPAFIFLVANISNEVEIAGQKLGVEDFIRKPFDNDAVVRTITRAISRHRQAS